jgi:ATP-dependent exoDNAse (exonuclease V) beta subunit
MSKPSGQFVPPDQDQRERSLDSGRSVLVQAPAGSGKTDLLTRRFLRLLAEVNEPGQVVAITFTNAAAAEMRHRILAELEDAVTNPAPDLDEYSMGLLAHRALTHSQALGWKLLDLPAQLRILTIDAFCRELALQQPLLSGLGGGLEIARQPDELYRRAARETLAKIDQTGSALGAAIEELLLWRDNNWQEMENLLVAMLRSRDRWMHNFVFEREPDWEVVRQRLERPFANVACATFIQLSKLFDQAPGARAEVLELARFACTESGGLLYQELAELAEFPAASFPDGLENAREFFVSLAELLQTKKGNWRSIKGLKTSDGFPSTPSGKAGKVRFAALIAQLAAIPGLEATLAAVPNLPPTRYTEDDWRVVRSCFTLLRHAAGELRIAFAEAGRVDFIEVAQIAQRVLRGEDGLPTDAALAVSDKIRHILVDEFQDTSRRQHQLLASLIAAWPERPGRTCFVVGDPMQSIYFFRDADAELFPRVKTLGLEIPHEEPLLFDFVSLQANFRTTPGLVARLNEIFVEIFATNDGSGVNFSQSLAVRTETGLPVSPFTLHIDFVPNSGRGAIADLKNKNEAARERQIEEIVELIRSHTSCMEQARLSGEKFRIAVLGRARKHLVPIAQALREKGIPFRAVELEELADRPEVLDALALASALLQPENRVAWLGVLRAPWCGLTLDDLHALAGNDVQESRPRPVPELLAERASLLSEAGSSAAARVLQAIASASALRASQPTASLGSWLEQVWMQIGGAACVDAASRANLDLLWSCLDSLPNGELDMLGSGLDAALDKLTALPDPAAGSDCGVQLMTIHKSKGLEFEVVIVPELQARSGSGGHKMLSWLERGLAEPDESGEITEFLIAPFQRKGAERGKARSWVDWVYREREAQETRRILYVAATRAREELHLFARPVCKEESGSFTLVDPTNSLLATAWPGLQDEIRTRFEEWKATKPVSVPLEEQEIESIAASGDLIEMPSPVRPTLLRRLPPGYTSSARPFVPESRTGAPSLYARHEGGVLSRALGTVAHALLEELARLRLNLDWVAARSALRQFAPRFSAQARAIGVDQAQATRIAAEALQIALSASHDPVGAWILSPHSSAASEASWAGVVAGALRAVRVDRVFKAGPKPGADGKDCWWIIDYKTTHADNLDPATALPALRALFAPQVEAYAEILRNLYSASESGCTIYAGLYYPRLSLLDWWEPES